MPVFTTRSKLIVGLVGLLALSAALWTAVVADTVPAPPPLASLDASAEQGKYLATAGNCASCHTAEGKAPYSGGVRFETPFGTLYSTNITPDSATGIGDWGFEDFYRAMKQGIRPDGNHLYPAFPYTSFAKMTEEDIASLYLHLQTVAPVTRTNQTNDMNFPFDQRPLLAFWKSAFHDTASHQPDPAQSETWNRGAYLVDAVAHCGACHSPRNGLGVEQKDQALTGGIYMDKVSRGGYRHWSAVNLTPAQTGLGAWSEEDFVSYFKTGQNRHTTVHGPMSKVVVKSTHYLEEEDLRAVATYLKGIPAKAREVDAPDPDDPRLAAGKLAYTVHCGSCHLPTGLGDKILGVPLAGNSIVQAPDPHTLINVILYGPDLPPQPFQSDRSRMKMFGKRLSDDDIANVATYVRASFGNNADPVTSEMVRAQR